jgi:hypothetical protein
VIKTLVEDLKRLQGQHDLRPDLLFFTGDLAWGHVNDRSGENLPDQFAEGHRFLEAARTASDPVIPRENVFLVPENHDFDRRAALTQLSYWFQASSQVEAVLNGTTICCLSWGRRAPNPSASFRKTMSGRFGLMKYSGPSWPFHESAVAGLQRGPL